MFQETSCIKRRLKLLRVRDEGSGISFKLPEFSQMPVVKGIAGLGESAFKKIGEGRRAVVKQASDILSPVKDIVVGNLLLVVKRI